jgi:hypothetical protein
MTEKEVLKSEKMELEQENSWILEQLELSKKVEWVSNSRPAKIWKL